VKFATAALVTYISVPGFEFESLPVTANSGPNTNGSRSSFPQHPDPWIKAIESTGP
jgi:hypothetical protein